MLASLGPPFTYADTPMSGKRYFYTKPKDEALRYAAYDIGVDSGGAVINKSIIYLTLVE